MCRINGITLIGRAIQTCRPVCDVAVSSDDIGILAEAKLHGAIPVRRPAELATSEAASVSALQHVCSELHHMGQVLFAQCTAPLMTTEDVQACADGLQDYDLSVVVHEWHGFLLNEQGRCPHHPLHVTGSPRRQEQRLTVCAGSVWSCNTDYVYNSLWWSGRINPVLRPGFRLEIDTQEDLDIARKLLANHENSVATSPGSWLDY